jgi:hypothetical protein
MSAQRAKKSYRIQLSVPLAVMLLGLGGISLVAAFYLGLVAGKSLRQPPESPVVSVPAEMPLSSEQDKDPLEFFNLSKEQSVQEELDRTALERLTRKTKELSLKENKPESEKTSESTEKSLPLASSSSNKVVKNEAKVTPRLKVVEPVKLPVQPAPILVDIPETKPPKKPSAKIKPVKKVSKPGMVEYTVQVFSGRSKRNAEKLVRRLKDEGFPGAYIFKHITADSKSLYRVRVGRMKKPEINTLARRIKSLKFIDSTQVTRF